VLPLASDQVAAHLGETVDWYHHLAAIEQQPIAAADSAAREKLHQQALTAVELALEFGKACARLLDAQSRQSGTPTPAATSKGFAGRLDQAAADVDQRVSTLQSQLDALNEQIAHARGKQRKTLIAQKAQVTAALQLAREVQESVRDMEEFEASSIAGDNGNLSTIDAQIADIERSVPELRTRFSRGTRGAESGRTTRLGTPDSSADSDSGGRRNPSGDGGDSASGRDGAGRASAGGASGDGAGGASVGSGASGGGSTGAGATATGSGAGASTPPASSATFRAESAGVIPLITEWFALGDMRRQLNGSIKETADLQDEIEKLRSSLVGEVRNVVGKDLAISTSTDPAQLLAQRQAVEADTARFKQLATVLVPLGEQALTVESATGTFDDWRTSVNSRMASVARYLALRMGFVLGWIAVVLIISEIWRRLTFRYLHDLRRRRQFLVLRRVVVAIALTLVIAFGLASEIGSIATYIGFVTAGIAVALQNVILAVVAYFFLIGRYGVRVGDRVTLAGVTGRVVDLGLVRVYLMELAGPDLHVTGRMVVLSNAVLFQPTALFKQIPGADYVWHTVTLTIAATADVLEAHRRLKAAADEVYSKYRPAIERQHAVVQRFIDFDASSPQPEVRVRLTENGLECSVRYPVELENAAVIDQQMLKALRDALEHDSQFKLVSSGAVVLKSSD
jgi:small-conductance mechanosensitive channel